MPLFLPICIFQPLFSEYFKINLTLSLLRGKKFIKIRILPKNTQDSIKLYLDSFLFCI